MFINPVGRIDYYSVMLYDCSVGDIFDKFNIDYSSQKELFCAVDDFVDLQIRKVVYRTDFFRLIICLTDHVLTAEDLRNNFVSYNLEERSKFFSKKYVSVKLEAAGSELNFIRKAGFNVEEMFMDLHFWNPICSSFKVTRADFAFDFVDHPYCPKFSKELAMYLSKFASQGVDRLCTSNSRASGLCYEVNFTPKSTCSYLGAKRSPEFVRVYDKLQEQAEKVQGTYDTSLWSENAENHGCQSWDRIELQTRREKAARFLFAEGSYQDKMRGILKYIFTNFIVCGSDHVAADFLIQYFDTSVIENLNFVQFGELEKYKFGDGFVTRIETWFQRNRTMLLVLFMYFGADGICDRLNSDLKRLYCSDDLVSVSQLKRFNMTLSECLLAYNSSFSELRGSFINEFNHRYLLTPFYSSDSLPLHYCVNPDQALAQAARDRLAKVLGVLGGDVNVL